MNKIAIVGAGKTGRGFIGRLGAEAGCEMLLVDKDAALVEKLNRAGEFTVSFFGGVREDIKVNNFRAATWEEADFSGIELIFVAVGGQNLQDVGEMLGRKLADDARCCVIACENASSPAEKLKEAMGCRKALVSEATVFCTTIENGELDIASENYPYLQCDADRLEGYAPFLPQVRPVGQFADFLTRKLYTYNAASCVIAYLGAVKGYTVYSDAANDPEILSLLDRNYEATNRAMCLEFGYDAADQAEFAELSRKKFTSTAIRDTVERNARDVARKLAPGERIIGIMQLIGKHGGDASVMEKTVAAALLYRDDPKWVQKRSEQSMEEILRGFCRLTDEAQIGRILDWTTRLEAQQ